VRQKFLTTTLIAGALAALGACAAPAAQPTAAPAQPTIALPASAAAPGPSAPAAQQPAAAPISLGVTASGEVTARRIADLGFRVPGTVLEVLVEEGAQVTEGQELARLDTAELELQIKQAEAGLAGAQANYERLVEGASAEEVAAARAQVAQAQAQLRTAQGSVTDQDIAAAEAALRQAQARQAEVRGGPKSADVTQAQSAVDQARANLDIQRTNLSAAKTSAQLQIEQAANALRDAQKAYSDIYWNNRNIEAQLAKFDRELPEELVQAEEQAMRQVESAEARLEQAKLAYDQASQNEVDGIAAGEAQLRTAEANLGRVLDGATADLVAGADAAVAQAQANLNKLRGDQRAGQLAAAQAGVSAAQANVARITADPSAATLAGAMAQVQQAEAGLEAAKLNRDKAVLKAPFAGVVSIVSIDPGDGVGQAAQQPAVQIVDVSELRVEVNISDTDVARVREGQPVEVRVDAVPGEVFAGTVSYVAPTATVAGNVRTYQVRVTLERQDGLRSGMSARVNILIEG
jgi:HlyD family secretion protein